MLDGHSTGLQGETKMNNTQKILYFIFKQNESNVSYEKIQNEILDFYKDEIWMWIDFDISSFKDEDYDISNLEEIHAPMDKHGTYLDKIHEEFNNKSEKIKLYEFNKALKSEISACVGQGLIKKNLNNELSLLEKGGKQLNHQMKQIENFMNSKDGFDYENLKKLSKQELKGLFSTNDLGIGSLVNSYVSILTSNVVMTNEDGEELDNKSFVLEEIENLLDCFEFEESNDPFDDYSDTIRYHHFNNSVEEKISTRILKEQNIEIKKLEVPLENLYFLHGWLCFETEDFEAAKNSFEMSLAFNPSHAQTYYELAEIYKYQNDFENFLDESLRGYLHSYKKEDVARAFRNFGYYFAEKREWQKALNNLVLSTMFDDNNEHYKNELDYITNSSDVELKKIDDDVLDEYSKTSGMSIGSPDNVVEILKEYANELYKQYDNKKAVIYLQYLYDLTAEKSVKDKIKEIKSGKHKK